MKPKILIIEDQKEYQLTLGTALSEEYELSFSSSVSQSIELINAFDFDLFLVDILLPDGNGLEISTYLRKQEKTKKTPIIMVTSRNSVDDKVSGFEHGADDYITKPFHYKELKARIKSKLKKPSSNVQPLEQKFIEYKNFKIDLEKQLLFDKLSQSNIDLTRTEFKLLVVFVKSQNMALTRDQLIEQVWPNKLKMTSRTVDTHISNLRKKVDHLGMQIHSVHGKGYSLSLHHQKAS
ncbi:MAG: response regulator transcription factor [Bdellovibrionales bacterium]|nr:response regulator transcription factor [Bdellovibrionales bacterium]